MSAVVRPRGKLPARVYWVRRLLLLGVVLMMVVGVHRLLSFDGSEAADTGESPVAASVVGAPFQLPTLALSPSLSPGMVIKPERRKARLPQPEGPCEPADLVVTPVIEAAHVARPVQIILELTTTRSPACTVDVSGESVAVNVSVPSGARELLWTTQDCPAALPEATVVARRDVPGRAVAEWSGRRSDDRCTVLNDWVLPGDYVVEAVALGGTETRGQDFTMKSGLRRTVTRTVTPTPSTGASGPRPSAPTSSATPRR
jgi:hypothetical protein